MFAFILSKPLCMARRWVRRMLLHKPTVFAKVHRDAVPCASDKAPLRARSSCEDANRNISLAARRTSMSASPVWKAAIGALGIAASSSIAAAQGAPPPPAVSVTPVVSRQVAETIDYVGRLTAVDKVDIVARVEGFLEERNFKEGQYVKTGDLLFRIEQATYKAAVEQARATLAKAKATEVNTKLQFERGKELVRNQNIPQSTVDQREADERAAHAGVMEAQAALDQAEINLGYTEIYSPIDGRIGIAIVTKGNLVQPSSGKLATIVSQDPIYVTFQVSQRNLLDYFRRRAEDPGKNTQINVRIKLPNGTIYPHAGVSDFLDVQVDPTTDTVTVRATVPNPEHVLIPGGVVGVTV